MKCDLLLELLLDFRLPSFEIDLARLQRAIEAHTQGQRTLVLMGKGDEIFIPEHTAIMRRRGPLRAKIRASRSPKGRPCLGRNYSCAPPELVHFLPFFPRLAPWALFWRRFAAWPSPLRLS